MLKITVILILSAAVIATLFKPWIGAFTYVIISVLSPQTIWHWGFESLRFTYVIALAIFASIVVNIAFNKISFACLRTRQNLVLLFLWCAVLCSFYFGGFPANNLDNNNLNSSNLLVTYCKIFIMFLLLQPLFENIKNIYVLIWGLVIVFGFYIYWANNQYFSGEMFLHGLRLTGPTSPQGIGNYTDDNTFAMLFVMAVPFFFFLAQGNKNIFIKSLLYILIPFAWHSVFLTGSRGGLVGLAVISIYIFLRSKKKSIGIIFAVGVLVALYYQGGDIMKSRSTMIVEYQKDTSALDRLEAWEIASSMCADWPVFGVGLGNFTVAWPDYSDTEPRVAHSTIIQFAAENGVFAALAFLFMCIFAAADLRFIRKHGKEMVSSDTKKAERIVSMANALEGACIGFFVCGLFLCLGTYEIFYYCIMLICLLKWHIEKSFHAITSNNTVNTGLLEAVKK